MVDFLPHLKPSKETLELFLRQLNGAKWLYWLPWRKPFLYSENEASELSGVSIEHALIGVHDTVMDSCSWPRTETESNQYWADLEKLEQMVGAPPEHVKRYLPGLILGEAEEYMLREATEERLPTLRYGTKRAEVADALVEDLKQALASEDTSLKIDDGTVRMVNGRLAIIMFEVDLGKARAMFEEGD